MKRLLLPALFLTACAAAPGTPAPEVRWSGVVTLEQTQKFPRGTRLVVEPGTVVRFASRDADGDGWGDVSLVLEGGDLVALGTPEAPVVFTSASAPAQPGSWGEARIDFGSVSLSHTVVEGSSRGLHLHFTHGTVADSVLRDNLDATRLGESRVAFDRILFSRQSGKGFNARASVNSVQSSWFRGNRYGVFLFESDEGSSFTGNRFTGNATSFRLGDFYQGTVAAPGNEWDRPPADFRSEADQDAHLLAEPAKVGETGPLNWPLLHAAWEAPLSGFVDADPLLDDLGVYAADWSGRLVRLGFLQGNVLAQASLGDTVDAAPALGSARGRRVLAVTSWNRVLTLLDAQTLAVLDRFAETPSPADDHRQAAPVFDGERLYAATWAGRLRAFDLSAGTLRLTWTHEGKGPFRAPPLIVSASGRKLLLAPCEDKTLLALDPATGGVVWSFTASGALVSGLAEREGLVYAGDRSGTLSALEAATGALRWSAPHPGALWYAPPLVAGELLLQGDDTGLLIARDAVNGAERWRVQLPGAVRSRPALVEPGLAAVADLSGALSLVRLSDGFLWDRLVFGGPLHTTPAVAGNRLLVGGRDGILRAVDVKTRRP